MIKYIKDENKKYEQDLIDTLVSYNEQFTGKVEFRNLYVYHIKNGDFKGGIQLSCGWNWASVKKVYYQDQNTLKKLIDHVLMSLDDTMLGIKFFTSVKERYKDFISVGFELVNQLENIGEYKNFYYANYKKPKEIHLHKDVEITISEVPILAYQNILNEKETMFETLNSIVNQTGNFLWVALDDDYFVGAISGEYYGKTASFERLAVIPSYRHQGIGKQLMMLAEEDARLNMAHFIELGTTSFQARFFYEKLGYHVIYTMIDYPKGYECYSLQKNLNKK